LKFSVCVSGKKSAKRLNGQKMIYLFAGDHYMKFVWSKYRKLRPITRRLFDYLASHREPYPLNSKPFA